MLSISMMLWSSTALAGMDEPQLAERLNTLQQTLNEPLLVAALGSDAQGALDRAKALIPRPIDIESIQLSVVPDAQPVEDKMATLRQERGRRCIARLAFAEDGGWQLETYGICTAPPPSPVSVQIQRISPEENPAYLDRKLTLTPLPFDPSPEAGTWDVVDRSQSALSATAFAGLVRDNEMSRSLRKEERGGLLTTRAFQIGGGVLLAGSLATLFTIPSTSVVSQRTDRLWTATFLLGTGGLALGVAPFAQRAVEDRQERPDNYYDEQAATEWIERYNQNILKDLGLIEASSATEPSDAPSPPVEDMEQP